MKLPAWVPVLGVLLALGAVLWWGRSQRAQGHAEGLGEAAAQHSDELAKVVKQRDTVYARRIDTLRRVLTRWDSIRVTDTVNVTHVSQPESVVVYVPRAAADTAVQMCLRTLSACDDAKRSRDSLIVALRGQLNLLKKSQPSRLSVVLNRALWMGAGIGVGVVAGR